MSAPGLFGDRVRLLVVAVAVMSLVATVGALVFGRRLSAPDPQPRDSYGPGALGHRAFVETMPELGVRVQRWTRPEWDSVGAPLFLIEPSQPWVVVQSRTTMLGDLVRARADAQRVSVLVLPKWSPGMLGTVDAEDPFVIRHLLNELPFAVELVRGPIDDAWRTIDAREEGREATRRLELRWPQRITGGVPVLSDDEGSFVVRDEKSLLYVVSDPDLLHSFNLHRGEHAAFWRDFARDTLHAEDIVVDEVFHGAVRTRSLAELFGRWPGVLVLVHGALVALVVLLMGRRRFGPPDPVPEALGRGPREVIEVAASVLAIGTRETRLALRYVEEVIGDVHRRLGLSEAATVDERAALIDQAAERRRLDASAVRLLAEVRAVEKTRRAREARAIARRAAELRAALLGTKKEDRA